METQFFFAETVPDRGTIEEVFIRVDIWGVRHRELGLAMGICVDDTVTMGYDVVVAIGA
jgi:hypothetical protein